MQSYIFQIPEIEDLILDFLDPHTDYQNLAQVNKYFNEIIGEDPVYLSLKKFSQNVEQMEIHPAWVFEPSKIQSYFMKACRYDYLHTAEYLFSEFKTLIDIHFSDEYVFRCSCAYGHLRITKFLLSIEKNIDIHVMKEWAFRQSCVNGHFETVKYLLSLKRDDKIDIHIENEYAFRKACTNGYLSIAKFLYSFDDKIDIHAKHDIAFYASCRNDHLQIAEWLSSLYKGYYLVVDNEEILDHNVLE